MSPAEVEVLLHSHGSQEPHPRLHAPAIRDAVNKFLEKGAIKPIGDGVYKTTELGREWVRRICEVPCPIDYGSKDRVASPSEIIADWSDFGVTKEESDTDWGLIWPTLTPKRYTLDPTNVDAAMLRQAMSGHLVLNISGEPYMVVGETPGGQFRIEQVFFVESPEGREA